jgi:uncharacterized protein (DUF433 family)
MPTTTSIETEVAPGIVRRTDRGLCIAGTRISLYLIMDYLKAGWPPHLIRHWLGLSEEEISNATSYIETNQAEFQAEYDEVVKKADAREKRYRERTRQIQATLVKPNLTPEQTVALARLQALKRAGKY